MLTQPAAGPVQEKAASEADAKRLATFDKVRPLLEQHIRSSGLRESDVKAVSQLPDQLLRIPRTWVTQLKAVESALLVVQARIRYKKLLEGKCACLSQLFYCGARFRRI